MHQSVRDYFLKFTKRFESSTDFFYLDIDGSVTIGYGNKVDPLSDGQWLVFTRPSGLIATPSEVSSAWLTVKNRQDWRKKGGMAFAVLTTIRATPESIQRLCNAKLDEIEHVYTRVFPDWECWPADAQLGALSMAWAMGPNFTSGWPKWTAACRAKNWLQASLNCHMADFANPGLRPRNAANVLLFQRAARAPDPTQLTA